MLIRMFTFLAFFALQGVFNLSNSQALPIEDPLTLISRHSDAPPRDSPHPDETSDDSIECPLGQYLTGPVANGMGGCSSTCKLNERPTDGSGLHGCICKEGFYRDGNNDCNETIGGTSPNLTCIEDPTCPEEEPTIGADQCHNGGYKSQECKTRWKDEYEKGQKEIAEAEESRKKTCKDSIKGVRDYCEGSIKKTSKEIKRAVTEPGSCSLEKEVPNVKNFITGLSTECSNRGNICENVCSAKTSAAWRNDINASSIAGECTKTATEYTRKLSAQNTNLTKLQENSQEACKQLTSNPDVDHTTTSSVGSPTPKPSPSPGGGGGDDSSPSPGGGNDGGNEFAGGSTGGGGGSSGSGLLSTLGGIASQLLGAGGEGSIPQEAYIPPPQFKVDDTKAIQSGYAGGGSSLRKSSGGNLDLSGTQAGGDDERNLPDIDDTKGNNTTFNGVGNNKAGNSPNNGNGIGSTTPQSARLASTDGGSPGAKNRRYGSNNSVEGRNLIGGYKKVKPTDGGGGLSIRGSDMKKYGRSSMKTRLNSARSKYGRKTPLIFKNGKFVRDFLAMKEAKGFKSRQASMEDYWKGNNRKSHIGSHKCVSLNQCHTNEKANIFKIMNFRLQKSFYKVKIDI